jgi:uncharacterized repeat protein (TIGR01451 family)
MQSFLRHFRAIAQSAQIMTESSQFKNFAPVDSSCPKYQLQKQCRRKHTSFLGLNVLLLTGAILLPVEMMQPQVALAASCSVGTITRISSPSKFYVDTGAAPSPLPTGMYVGYKITNTSGTAYSDLWVKLETFSGGIIGLGTNEDGIVHVGSLASGASTTVYVYLQATGAPSSGNSVPQSHTVSLYPTRPDLAAGSVCGDPFSLVTEQTIKAVANKITIVVSGPTPSALGGIVTETINGDTGTIGAAGIFAFTPASDPNWPANAYQLVSSQIVLSGGNTGTYTNQLYLSGLNGPTTAYTITYTYIAVGTTATPTGVSPVSYLSSGTQIKHNDTGDNAALPPIQPTTNTTTFSSKTANPTALPTGGTVNYTITLTNASTNSSVSLDDIVDTLPSVPGIATYVAGSAKFNGVAISDPKISGQTLTFLQLFTIPASSTRTLTYQATIPNVVGTYTNQVVGHIGSTQIDGTLSTTDNVPATANVTVGPLPVSLSGTVFDDIDGSKLQNSPETGTNAAGLNAILIDSSNKVVATTTIAADGTYTFSTLTANANYTVQITTAIATIGAAPPAITLPSNWVNTGENFNSAIDGAVDSKLSVSVTTSNVTGVNFGIEQLPNTTDLNPASQTNPGGTTTVQVPTLAGTDPEDGALGSGKSFKIVTLPTNGTLTYNNSSVIAGQVITSYDPTLLKLDPNDGTITVSFTYAAIDAAGKEDSTPATVTMPFTLPALLAASGTVFSDADADVTINGSDAGTNAGSANLTIYAIDTAGKVLDKGTVAANGTYTLTKIPQNSSVTLRLSNDSTVAIGATAPTVPSIPSGWYYTGENLNGTIDPVIATLGDIALTTTTSNLTNENFGIRQAYTIAADIAPTTCNPDYRTALNTGITAAGGQVAVGANDLNWTAEWIVGPGSGPATPYAPPRPVGVMPAVVVGNLASGAWINEPANARWISYPFRLPNNSNGVHTDADLDGNNGEGNTGFSGPGTSDDVRLKFTSQVTLPSNANTIAISLPVGVAIDNQFVSIKVNGVENLVPTPAANPLAADYGTTKNLNLTKGWQTGVNTIEIIVDSGPNQVGFFLGVQATTTQVCTNPNVLLVKRITAINGDRTKNPNDNTALNTFVDDTISTRQADDNSLNWKANYLLGAIDAGKVKPGDEIEYTVYFLNAGSTNANTVRICDRITANQDFKVDAYGTNKDVQLQLGTSTVVDLTSASDAGDRAELISAGGTVATTCNLKAANDNGTLVIDVTGNTGVPNLTTMPGSTGQGSPNDSYGFLRFVTKVKP